MKLFGHDTSPYVRRARALLAELGVSFDRDVAGWATPSDGFLRASPVTKVPALEVEENGERIVLLDSRTIAEWLFERCGVQASAKPASPKFQPTLFSSSQRYADANVLTVIDAALDSAIQIFLFERDGVTKETAPYLKRQHERVGKCLAWLDARYAGKSTLHDGAFGYVDLSLYCALDWLEFRQRLDLTSYRSLVGFKTAHASRPSFAATDPRLAEDTLAAKK